MKIFGSVLLINYIKYYDLRILFFIFLLSFVFSVNSSAQNLIGLNSGILNSNVHIDFGSDTNNYRLETQNKWGISASFFYQEYFSKRFSLRFNLQFGNYGAIFSNKFTYNFYYLSFPMLIRYDIVQSSMYSLSFHSGWAHSLLSGGNIKSSFFTYNIKPGKDFLRYNLFFDVGIGIMFKLSQKTSFSTDINLNRGLSDIYIKREPEQYPKMKNRAVSFTVGLARKI